MKAPRAWNLIAASALIFHSLLIAVSGIHGITVPARTYGPTDVYLGIFGAIGWALLFRDNWRAK